MKNLFIGIDFAAKKFDVAVIYAEGLQEQAPAEYNQFENTDEGFKAFVSSKFADESGEVASSDLAASKNN